MISSIIGGRIEQRERLEKAASYVIEQRPGEAIRSCADTALLRRVSHRGALRAEALARMTTKV
jgi:hypothetical protein